jgi:hypothetical protein
VVSIIDMWLLKRDISRVGCEILLVLGRGHCNRGGLAASLVGLIVEFLDENIQPIQEDVKPLTVFTYA